MAAAIVAHATAVEGLDTAINVLGRSLGKAREPLKVAEEYALLDTLSGGRLIAGMPVGLSYDANQNGGIPPIETRFRAQEGRALLEKAWSATEPFAWNGKYSRYPFVNIWPRPIQQPRPPFWVPGGGTPSTLAEVLDREDVFTYLSWFGPTLTGRRIFDRFWDIADQKGRDHNPYRLAFLQTVCVADTDAEAERLYGEHLQTHFRNGLGAIPLEAFALPGYIDIRGVEAIVRDPGDLGIAPKLRTITFRELADTRAAIVGSAATVREQITEFVKECRIGNLLVMLHVGSMPHELARHNISLFASDVLPHLRTSGRTRGGSTAGGPPECRPARAATRWPACSAPLRESRPRGIDMHVEASGVTLREEVLSVWNDQLEIHVKIAGAGPPLLFLHSAGGPRWVPFLDRLSGEYTIYAPELPGTSPADPHAIHKVETFADLLLMYEELVRGLGIAGAVAIGESLGGMMAADLAAHFPSLFSKLVLLSPAGLWRDDAPPRAIELISGPPERAPEYLFFDHEGELARAFFALPDDPS